MLWKYLMEKKMRARIRYIICGLLFIIGAFAGAIAGTEANAKESGLIVQPYDPLPFDLRVFPNPFDQTTSISYTLHKRLKMRLVITDNQGKTVAILVNNDQDKGNYVIQWGGTDTQGTLMPSGVYYLRMQANTQVVLVKMFLIRP
jgi:hypothetical protein